MQLEKTFSRPDLTKVCIFALMLPASCLLPEQWAISRQVVSACLDTMKPTAGVCSVEGSQSELVRVEIYRRTSNSSLIDAYSFGTCKFYHLG